MTIAPPWVGKKKIKVSSVGMDSVSFSHVYIGAGGKVNVIPLNCFKELRGPL